MSRVRTWLVALCALAATALSLGLPGSPAGAQGTVIVAITGNPNPGATGTITYDVTVTGAGTAPTGSVGVDDAQGGTCTTASLSDNLDGSSSGSCTITENAANSPFTVTATYPGDLNYATNTGTVQEVVDKGTPNVAITGTPNPGTTGSISYGVTVSGDGVTPTGSVGVSDGQGGSCSIANLDGAGSGSCSIVENAASSSFTVTATYAGDANYSSNIGTVQEVVDKGTPTVAVTGTPNPGTTGSISYGVMVDGNGAVPTGSVNVSDGQGGNCSISSLDGTGSGSCDITENAADSPLTVTATYHGDSNYSPNTGTVQQVVNVGTPTVAVTGTPNPGTTGQHLLRRDGQWGRRHPDRIGGCQRRPGRRMFDREPRRHRVRQLRHHRECGRQSFHGDRHLLRRLQLLVQHGDGAGGRRQGDPDTARHFEHSVESSVRRCICGRRQHLGRRRDRGGIHHTGGLLRRPRRADGFILRGRTMLAHRQCWPGTELQRPDGSAQTFSVGQATPSSPAVSNIPVSNVVGNLSQSGGE